MMLHHRCGAVGVVLLQQFQQPIVLGGGAGEVFRGPAIGEPEQPNAVAWPPSWRAACCRRGRPAQYGICDPRRGSRSGRHCLLPLDGVGQPMKLVQLHGGRARAAQPRPAWALRAAAGSQRYRSVPSGRAPRRGSRGCEGLEQTFARQVEQGLAHWCCRDLQFCGQPWDGISLVALHLPGHDQSADELPGLAAELGPATMPANPSVMLLIVFVSIPCDVCCITSANSAQTVFAARVIRDLLSPLKETVHVNRKNPVHRC